jgi:hypothetical protein
MRKETQVKVLMQGKTGWQSVTVPFCEEHVKECRKFGILNSLFPVGHPDVNGLRLDSEEGCEAFTSFMGKLVRTPWTVKEVA